MLACRSSGRWRAGSACRVSSCTREYPFQVAYADWFDRLAAPIRFYYDGDAMRGWLDRAQLDHTAISPTGLFGWRAYGERP